MKRYLIDVDGVVADFIGASLQSLELLGGPRMTPEEITTWQMLDVMPSEWAEPLRQTWRSPGWCAGMSPYSGATQAVAHLRRKHDVIFVTAALEDSPYWMWERSEWLKEHFDASHENIIFTWAKHVVVGDVFIDDKPANILGWAEAHPQGTAVLWDAPHNQNMTLPPGIIRTKSWGDVLIL